MAKICLLSSSEAQALELYGRKPTCSNHTHATRDAVDEMIKGGDDVRWIGKAGYRLQVGTRKFWKKVTERRRVYGYGDDLPTEPLGFATMQLVK